MSVEDFLYHYFKPNTVIVGYDHHFGKGRNGNIELLKTMGAKLHFQVEEINEQLVQKKVVTSIPNLRRWGAQKLFNSYDSSAKKW